jgi:hypothetical protein
VVVSRHAADRRPVLDESVCLEKHCRVRFPLVLTALVFASSLRAQITGAGADKISSAGTDFVMPTIMGSKVMTWTSDTAAGVNVLKSSDGKIIYQIYLSRHWYPNPEPSAIAYKDVSAFVSDQAGNSVPLNPMYKKYGVMLEAGNGAGGTSNGLFVANAPKGFEPKAVRLSWDGVTRTLPLEVVK